MPKVRRASYNLAFKLKVVAEEKAVENNSEIARNYGISECMVRASRQRRRDGGEIQDRERGGGGQVIKASLKQNNTKQLL